MCKQQKPQLAPNTRAAALVSALHHMCMQHSSGAVMTQGAAACHAALRIHATLPELLLVYMLPLLQALSHFSPHKLGGRALPRPAFGSSPNLQVRHGGAAKQWSSQCSAALHVLPHSRRACF